jgi:EAL domain-containing protein (putative c-di-GMP-specific phosphodiesterase class I)
MDIHVNMEHSDNDLRRFWDLENIGIISSQEGSPTTEESQVVHEFSELYLLEDGRRIVSLPKKKICELFPNRSTAEIRFRTLQKRLQQDDALRLIKDGQMYHVMKQQVEHAPTAEKSTGVFYLPHHAVKKERRGKMN